jgi:hypothetical protein
MNLCAGNEVGTAPSVPLLARLVTTENHTSTAMREEERFAGA